MNPVRSLTLFILFILASAADAQIYSPAASDSFGPKYNGTSGTDKVFIFNRISWQQPATASIIAVSEDRLDGWTFTWAKYNPNTNGYEATGVVMIGWQAELGNITSPGGYQVTMTKAAVTSVFRVWIVFNDFQVVITNKGPGDTLSFGYYNCSSLDLRADTNVVSGYFYDPSTGIRQKVPNSYDFRWKTDNPDAATPSKKLITRVYDPPSKDTWYILTVTDNYGLLRKDSVFYKSIQSQAVIEKPEYHERDSLYYSPNIETQQSAPGVFTFDVSGSKNAASYNLDFGDGEILDTTMDAPKIDHTYQKPGTYKITLTTKSKDPYGCVDTITTSASLAFGDFWLPNVFTPNGQGVLQNDPGYPNNIFRSWDVSVVEIDITIFDRAGVKMHHYSGNIEDWKGWDGNVMNSSRKAPDGVYFWTVNAILYFENPDPVPPPEGRKAMKEYYSGFFHLYRGAN